MRLCLSDPETAAVLVSLEAPPLTVGMRHLRIRIAFAGRRGGRHPGPDAREVVGREVQFERGGQVGRTPDGLRDHVAVGYFSTRTGRELDWEYRDKDSGECRMAKMRRVVAVSRSQAYLARCLAGPGMIQAPRDSLASGRLVEVLMEWRADALPVSVMFPHGRHVPPRVRILIDRDAETLSRPMRAG